MDYAVILAGGTGSRFWPLSRQDEPKQFLNLCSNKPMIEETISRICPLIKKNNIYIATNKIYHKNIKSCLKKLQISPKNVFFEPESRNTFAPIGVLSWYIYNKDKEAVILVLPADHYIKDVYRFLRVLDKTIATAKKGYILTLGITPDRPETGYGYIKVGLRLKAQGAKVYKVEKFIEKPNFKRAKEFLKNKKYYWNAGIFIFKAATLLGEAKRLAPVTYNLIRQIKNNRDLDRLWQRLPSISVDYAIMERTKKMALIPADFGWMDLGSWQAIAGLAKKDRYGNVFQGNCVDIGSKDTIAFSDNRLLATLGLKDIIIVNTKDATLVCAKDKSQDVRKIVQLLKQKKRHKQI